MKNNFVELPVSTPDGRFTARYSEKGLAELDFGHVLDRRLLGPSGFRDRFAHVDRGTAGRAARRTRIGGALAPRAGIERRIGHWRHSV